ncbi:FAS1-like dehydratase domain-containing protein [Ramlibacter albus]|uniref:MaoC family dehydratase N-terminal domain-containing protein n=1 Tax=Ramlibacter albus TaxID=2079448 RepID=A0A923M857_9BURK|nr:MaoC family dehydratase N-terminal domain-containing protein [Ramlibacter albus]MBC5765765.1 MaoC family dehydratase N-terminal domain-containing protein [Ramlibacter albus]
MADAPLQTWIGKTETLTDEITAAPLRAMSATLDRDDVPPQRGSDVPPLWHWLYFLPMHPAHEIGPDGHAKRGGFLPPVPLPRRMWAGGRLEWNLENPLQVGDVVKRVSRIASVNEKSGRTGNLVFVTVVHEYHNVAGLALTEEHDIVYRDAPKPGDPVPEPTRAEEGAPWHRELVPDDVLLFRYSALTFNGHRIHYDRRYVTEVEGYPGLIVHGPLIATLLVDLLRRKAPTARLKKFEFKAVRPTFDGNPMRVNGRLDGNKVALWANDHQGFLTMKATAEIE